MLQIETFGQSGPCMPNLTQANKVQTRELYCGTRELYWGTMGPPLVKFDPDTVAPFRTFTDNVRK